MDSTPEEKGSHSPARQMTWTGLNQLTPKRSAADALMEPVQESAIEGYSSHQDGVQFFSPSPTSTIPATKSDSIRSDVAKYACSSPRAEEETVNTGQTSLLISSPAKPGDQPVVDSSYNNATLDDLDGAAVLLHMHTTEAEAGAAAEEGTAGMETKATARISVTSLLQERPPPTANYPHPRPNDDRSQSSPLDPSESAEVYVFRPSVPKGRSHSFSKPLTSLDSRLLQLRNQADEDTEEYDSEQTIDDPQGTVARGSLDTKEVAHRDRIGNVDATRHTSNAAIDQHIEPEPVAPSPQASAPPPRSPVVPRRSSRRRANKDAAMQGEVSTNEPRSIPVPTNEQKTQAPSALLDPKVKEIERDYMRRSGGDIRKVMELYLQRNVSEGERWPRLEKGMEFQKKMRSEPFKLLKGKDGPSSAKDSGFPKSKRHTSSGQSSGQALSQLSGQSSRPQHQEVPISGNKEGLHSLNGSAPKESQPLLAEDQQVTAPIAYPADETADPDQPPSNAVQKKAGEPRKKKRHLMDNLQSDLGVKWAPNVTEDGYRPTRQR